MFQKAAKSLSKMHVRRNPNLSLEPTAQYSQLEPPSQPHSAASGFLSPTAPARRGLLARSPPPSPSLPSLIHRHGKKPHYAAPSWPWKRIALCLCGAGILAWLVLSATTAEPTEISWDKTEYTLASGELLPDEPAAIVVLDARGRKRWTVSIPPNYDFPLRPNQYRDICHGAHELATQVRGEVQKSNIVGRMLGYNARDKYFLDVGEAQAQGLLPPSMSWEGGMRRPKGFVDDEAIVEGVDQGELKPCDKSLTYVLETDEAGFGGSLMRLWMAYGLAKAEGRSFFIDDTRWPYGSYLSYFLPPPPATCTPPSPSQILPCPHTARHLVVSSATTPSTFGHAFTDAWEDARKMRVDRQHKIFALARAGYEALFRLRGEDAAYTATRDAELYGPMRQHGGLSIGVHIRHGDVHPMQFQFSKDYIPLERYVDAARDLYIEFVEEAAQSTGDKQKRHTASKLVVASDDPLVYASTDLGPNVVRAQDRIVLASKANLAAAESEQGEKKEKKIDDLTGWEGGFYPSVFLSLGQPTGNAGDMSKLDPERVPEAAMRLRELVGRAYLLDLAVLGKADTVVCTVSATACKLLAVMMGWDRAIKEGRWRNIDGEFEWRGVVW